MKIQITILLFFIFTCNLLASHLSEMNNPDDISATVAAPQGNDTEAMNPSTITDESGGGGIVNDKSELNSILTYSILIFFSVLIIILIDNRNLEKRYKKLVIDLKNKDPLL